MQMQLVDAPSHRPNVCVDGSQTGPLVDTQLTHPLYGRMYWPERLVKEAARLYGMVPVDEHADLVSERDGLRTRVAELEGELAELQPVRDALIGAAERFAHVDDEPRTSAPRRRVAA